MADNRMYLRCKACGEMFFLGKRLGNGYYISQYEQYKGVPLMERLNKFYDDHEWCGENGLDCFELIYEVPPEPLTNADRIRSMTDEELAVWIHDQIIDRNIGIPSGTWLDWLKEEAKNA